MFEYDQAFRDLMVREPIIGFVERVLGGDCHVIAQNALRTACNNGIVNWHIDDHLFFPCPPDQERHSSQWTIPCYALNVMIALTRTETIEYGPTQVLPGSHYSGTIPPYGEDIVFGEQYPLSVFATPGDVYILNSQIWHRGAQNRSDRIRLVASTVYGRRFLAQRFYPFLNYCLPEHVLLGADERLLRLLGKHPKGPYG